MRFPVCIIQFCLFCLFFYSGNSWAKNISTLSGKTYYDISVTAVYPTGIGISYRQNDNSIGSAYLDFSILPEHVRKEYEVKKVDVPQPKDSVLISMTSDEVTEITTLAGEVYKNIEIVTFYKTGIVFKYPDGKFEKAKYLNFSDMPLHLQRRFGYDPVAIEQAKQREQKAQQRLQKQALLEAQARHDAETKQKYEAPSIATRDYGTSRYSSSAYSGGGTVQVKGYYRKDGTYVRSHSRRKR